MAEMPVSPQKSPEECKKLCQRAREIVLTMAHRAKNGHVGSSLSSIDILGALYHSFLRVDPKNPKMPDRDRFILSKGHGCSGLYATLALKNFYPESALEQYLKNESMFAGHPSALHVPGVELSTGSLGHGLNVGVGMALAAQRDEKAFRTVVVLSDGECDEGSVWEAALTAGHWKLDQLIAIVDYNKIQSFGRVEDVMQLEPFTKKWESFGWHVQEVDGHDHAKLMDALAKADTHEGKPHVIIAHTVKGKGVSFMENTVEWHYWPPSDAQYAQAMQEISSSK